MDPIFDKKEWAPKVLPKVAIVGRRGAFYAEVLKEVFHGHPFPSDWLEDLVEMGLLEIIKLCTSGGQSLYKMTALGRAFAAIGPEYLPTFTVLRINAILAATLKVAQWGLPIFDEQLLYPMGRLRDHMDLDDALTSGVCEVAEARALEEAGLIGFTERPTPRFSARRAAFHFLIDHGSPRIEIL